MQCGPKCYHKAFPTFPTKPPLLVCCEQQSDFPMYTYLLLCEEDVSVAQLKKKERTIITSWIQTPLPHKPSITFPHHLPTQRFLPQEKIDWREQDVPTEIPDNEISALPDGKCSWMCFGGGGSHWRPGIAGELNYIKCAEFLRVVQGSISSLHGTPARQNSQSGRDWTIIALRLAATLGLIHRHLNLSWKQQGPIVFYL